MQPIGRVTPPFFIEVNMKITYIGKKSEQPDIVGRTGIIWQNGETLEYPDNKVRLLLQYADVWAVAEGEDISKGLPATDIDGEIDPNLTTEDDAPFINMSTATKEQLNQYSIAHFGRKLNPRDSIDTMRQNVSKLQAGAIVL
jgi:hypothetical protein